MRSQISLKPPKTSFKAIFFLLFLLNLAFALNYPSFNGYQILDLTSKNIDSFYLETQKWTVSGLAGTANSSLCGPNNPLLGGYEILSNNAGMSKTYSSLPTHTAVYYQITFNFIDKFKNPDYFTLTLDSTSIAGGSSLKTYNSYVTSNICGGSDADTTQFTIAGSMPHTADTLNFQLTAKVATGSGSGTLGIRDIQLTFVNDSSVTTASSCFRVFDSTLLGIPGECSCKKGSYYSSGSCATCNPACQNCFGSSASQCYACASGHSWDGTQCIKCDSSCLTCKGVGSLQCVTCQDGYWLQPNGSCTLTCDLPSTTRQAVGSLQLCYAGCMTSQYILWNGTCVNNCSSPLVTETGKLCNKPCKTGEYLYGNESCIVGCSGTFLTSSVNGVSICSKPCLTGEYLDWNNNCIPGCSTPLVSSFTSDGILTCNKPCQTGESFYWNNSCIAGCVTPLVSSSTSDSVMTCNQPCKTGEYLNWNNLCIGSCPNPFILSISNDNVALCNKPCENNEFLYSDGSCLTTCLSPFIPSNTTGIALCSELCQNNEYLYWNGDCNPTCLSPLVHSSTSQGLFCNKPCRDFEYLYEDDSCQATCPTPYLMSNDGEVSLCKKPCQNNEFLDWNNACIASCSTPLVSSTINGIGLCNKPCQNNEYLYSDGSCLSACSSPYVSSSYLNVDLCQAPCSSTSQFLYPDDSCLARCPAPLVSSITTKDIKRCNSPCTNPSDYYYNANNTCGASCSSPGTTQTIEFLQVCLTPLTSSTNQGGLTNNEIQLVDQAKSTTNAAGAAASVGVTASSLISSQSSGAITLISLIKMLDYIRYMKISYPPKLEYMMDSQNKDPISLNFNVNLPRSIENKFPDYPLPGKFGKYDLVSSFVVNYWEESFTLGVLLLILGITITLASRAKHVKYVGTYSAKIRDILKWNFFLIVLCGNVDSVGVFSSLELRTTPFNSFVSVFGTLVCVFINLLVLYLMLMIPYIIYSLRRARRKIIPAGKVLQPGEYNAKADSQRFALCGVLFMNFKEKSVFQHSCMFFILLRVYFFNIIIGYLFEYPLTQAILITTMSALMLAYFSIARPFKNPLELIKTLTYETIIAVVNISVLILAIMDHNGIKNKESRVQLGDVIIISNMVFNLMAVLFIAVELVIKIIKVYKLRKTITAKGWRYWLTILTFLLEPEELEMEDDETPGKEEPVFRITIKRATKLEEKLPPAPAPKKTVSFKHQTVSDGHDSDIALEKTSSIQTRMVSTASRLNFNKVGILKSNSILSLDGFSDIGSRNLLTPANARASMLFSQGHLSPRSLLYEQGNNSGTPSPRMLLRSSSQLSFPDFENHKFVNDNSLSIGTPLNLGEEKGMFIHRNKSTEVLLSHRKDQRRRNMKLFTPSSVILDNSEIMSEFSLEIGNVSGRGIGAGMNMLHRQQSRFSKYSPEKSKILPEEDA